MIGNSKAKDLLSSYKQNEISFSEPGELLIAESPLFVVPWWARHTAFPRQELKEMVEAEVDDMAEITRERFYALCDSKCEPGKW